MAEAALADPADLAVRAGSKNEEAAADRLPRKDWKTFFLPAGSVWCLPAARSSKIFYCSILMSESGTRYIKLREPVTVR